MTSAEELFTQAFNTINSRFLLVSSLRQVAKLGKPNAAPTLYKESESFAQRLFTDLQYEGIFSDKQKVINAVGGVEGMGKKLADNKLSLFQSAIDSASLVFAHSILDSVTLDYLKVTAAENHMDLFSFIEQKQIPLSSLRDLNYDDIVKEKVYAYLDSLDRQSLLMKVDRLFQICKPEPDFKPMDDYQFDRDRLEKLDKLRHDIIHGAGPVIPIQNVDDDIWYLQKTAFFFMSLVNMRYDTRINSG